MKQIIIRRDAVFALHANVSLKGYPSYDIPLPSPEAAGPLLKDVVKEELPLDTLLREYQQVMAGEDSALFARMYQISETSDLVIDGHICLYHCDPCPVWVRFEEKQWAYMSGRKYLADAWWFEDAEILKDIQTMNLIDFLEKYKGW